MNGVPGLDIAALNRAANTLKPSKPTVHIKVFQCPVRKATPITTSAAE